MANRKPITTDKEVRALKAESAPYEHAMDAGRGLRIKVLPSGRKTWFNRYRRPDTGKLEVVRLGHYPTMSLADARTEVERQRAIVREHGSAKQYRQADQAVKAAALAEQAAEAERTNYTVAKLVTAYLEAASRELKSWREVDRA